MKTAVAAVEEEDNPEVQEGATVEEERSIHRRRRSRVKNEFSKT